MTSIVPGTFANMDMGTFDPKDLYYTPAMRRFHTLSKFYESTKFTHLEVKTIAVSHFGSWTKPTAGFAYMHADVEYNSIDNPVTKEPLKVPGLAFIRGDSVAMLMFLNYKGIDYVLLTEQARVPIGEPNYLEAIAGMTDAAEGKCGYAAAIAKELEEEVGLTLDRKTDFIEIGKMIPSAGGCDERIGLYWTRVNCTHEVLAHLEGKLGGALLENEQITARLKPVSLIRKELLNGDLTDAKLITALWFYDNRPELHGWSCKKSLVLGENGKAMMI